MIRAQYSLLADTRRVGENGNFDLFGIFDSIAAPDIPFKRSKIVWTVLLVSDDPAECRNYGFRVEMASPSGIHLFNESGRLDISPVKHAWGWVGSCRLDIELAELPISEFGTFRFRIELEGVEVARHPLTISKSAQA